MKFIKYTLLILLVSCFIKSDKEKYAELLIEKVENFKLLKNRLPKNSKELGLEESENSKAFYQLETDTSYIIWYGLNLGESKVYYSIHQQWKIVG